VTPRSRAVPDPCLVRVAAVFPVDRFDLRDADLRLFDRRAVFGCAG
jgi:hypothetical protein